MTNLFIVFILVLIFKSGITHSGSEKTIQKCCPKNYTVILKSGKPSCFQHQHEKNFSEIKVYNKNKAFTENILPEMFKITQYQNFDMKIQKNVTFGIFPFRKYNKTRAFLYDDGTLDVQCENDVTYCNFSNHLFCLEYVLFVRQNKMLPFIFTLDLDLQDIPNHVEITTVVKLQIAAMLTSSFFLLLVLAVYAVLRELRTLGGLIVMATVISLMMTFILMAILKVLYYNGLTDSDDVCKGFTFTIYFFILAFLFWMNIMSFDVWWTFRGFAATRPIHRRGIKHKFLMYCIYAWGTPALMMGGAAIVNEIGLRRPTTWLTPGINKDNCFMGGNERLYYLFVPMLILLTANCIFFIMTACSIRELQRGHAMLDRRGKNNQRLHKFRFLVYIKLSMVMGISWVLEVVSALVPDFQGFFISDAYNALTGLFIFIIFVCKPKIWKQLKNRFAIPVTSSRDRRCSMIRFISYSSSSTASTDSELEHSVMPVCLDPQGNEKCF